MDKYKLIFRGQLKEGKDQAAIGRFLCKFLAIAETNAEKLFSGRAYALKSNLLQQQAYDLQGKLNQAGILTDVIREKPLQNDVTYQEKVIQTEQGHERLAEPDYKMKVGDKTLCRHCGSHLSDTSVIEQRESQNITLKSTQVIPPADTKLHAENDLSTAEIDSMNVSNWWKERFVLFHKAGASRMSMFECYKSNGFMQLTQSERKKLQFSLFVMTIGFAIGPLIYLLKGMFRKGLILMIFCAMFNLVLDVVSYELDIELNLFTYSLCGMAIVQLLYAFDYYKYRIQNETLWPWLPAICGSNLAIILGLCSVTGLYALWLSY